MVNVTPYDFMHVVNTSNCKLGIGCIFKNINEVGAGFPMLAVLVTTFAVATFGLIKAGNDTLKSVTATSALMCFITLLGLVYTSTTGIPLLESTWFVSFAIFTSVFCAVLVYRRTQQ